MPRAQDLLWPLVLLALVTSGTTLPFLRPALGLWVVFVLPVRLLLAKLDWRSTVLAERVVHAVAAVVLALMAGGLALNSLGPLLGLDRPLDPLPVSVTITVCVWGLAFWRADRLAPAWGLRGVAARVRSLARQLFTDGLHIPYPPLDSGVLVLAVLALLASIGGANRLNNGHSSGLALTALTIVVAVFALLLRFRIKLREMTHCVAIYLVAATLLLGTSLRGWHITGHDIQREFRVFEATLDAGHWSPGIFRDAYNACLSITILPTLVEQMLGIDPAYVYKFVIQLLFAFTPVGVYLLARRTSSVGTALLGVLFFVSFPTFFTDMPFLTRQEVAFLFLVAALLAVTQHGVAVSHRRMVFVLFAAGTVLSHYSTAYILIGVTAMAGIMRLVLDHGGWVIPRRMRWLTRRVDDSGSQPRRTRTVVTISSVLMVFGMVFLWSGVLTGTGGQLVKTLSESATELLHPGTSDTKSVDVGYNLLPSPPIPPQTRLDTLVSSIYQDTAAERTPGGDLLPKAQVERYPLKVEPAQPLALTQLGSAMDSVGLDPGTVNRLIRQTAAKLLQVFVFVGLVALAFGFRNRFKPTGEIVLLGIASFAVVVSQVVLPQVSADYGVLRAFQQALIVLAPFLATGLLICFRWVRDRSDLVATGFAIAFLASLIGLLPQLTGGYPAQLQLNNSGSYYDAYYTRTPELVAVDWLARAPGARDNVQFSAVTDRLTSPAVQSRLGTSPRDDLFPPYLRRTSYVLIDATTVSRGVGIIAISGDTISYDYPLTLLERTRNLVYSNGSAKVYR
jgi:uncharacterized membrane protein